MRSWTRLLPSSQLLFLLSPRRTPQLLLRNSNVRTTLRQPAYNNNNNNNCIIAPKITHQSHTAAFAHSKDTEFESTIKMSAHEQIYASLAKSLLTDIVDATDPSPERANDILTTIRKESNNEKTPMTVSILTNTKIGKMLTKTVKACKRHKRTSDQKDEWNTAISTADRLLSTFKEVVEKEAKQQQKSHQRKKKKAADTNNSASDDDASSPREKEGEEGALPTSVSAYKTRLSIQKKEIYKDPPSLPPVHILIEDTIVTSKPKRNKTNGELTFARGEDDSIQSLLRDFHPNRTPEEVLRAGAFGGTYFCSISSAVTNVEYSSSSVLNDTVQPEWIVGLNASTRLTSSTYRKSVNKFGVKCGGSLGMWESSGWIADSDPYGWFQWYCRFYSGRRCSDDARQIGRWCKSAGMKGRFRSQLCNKVMKAGTVAGDERISPVIRQTLLHWGLEVTEDVLEKHKRRLGGG